ncbi:MAG: zinc-dependent alcohol dehydrogenase [Candidatus Oleimicrobiaceae bacterium]
MEEMLAVTLVARRQVEIRRLPRPRIGGPHDVLLRMAYAGICGSDLHYYRDGRIGDQRVRFPMVLGHEGSAVVVELGEGVRHLRQGQEVVVDPALVCGTCDQCRAGRSNTCRALRFLGSPGGPHGCMAQYILMPEACCHPLPPQVSLRQAVIAEPLAIALHSLRLLGPRPPRSMVVFGAGPLGLCVVAAARAKGVGQIFVIEPLAWRGRTALSLGAQWWADPGNTQVVPELLAAVPEGVEVVVECCGAQQALDQALQLLAPGGRLVIVGIPPGNRVRFDINLLRRKELSIVNVRRQNNCMSEAVHMLAHELPALSLITHENPLSEVASAFACTADYAQGVIKTLLRLQ